MNLLAFALLGAGAMTGFVTLDPKRIARAAALILLGVAVAVFATRALLASAVDTTYRKAELLKGMHLAREPLPAIVHKTVPPGEALAVDVSALQRILGRGTLRVGYSPDVLPFTFVNARGELVGFDIELAGLLARDLGVSSLELVPIEWAVMPELLRTGAIDVVMTVPYAVYWIRDVRFSVPHTDGVYAFAARDDRRHEFATLDAVRAHKGLTIGVPVAVEFMQDRIRNYLGPVDAKFVSLPSPREFFEGKRPDIDALLVRAEVGTAWALLHPEYSVIVPQPVLFKAPAGVAMARDSADLADFVNEWLVIQQAAGNIQRAYDYWILGGGAEKKGPRWSILRNVLGWGQ
jgi:ABC-type amino acid transport substrate-binding protein